jgi:predicted RNase H-like HicB family nuclease
MGYHKETGHGRHENLYCKKCIVDGWVHDRGCSRLEGIVMAHQYDLSLIFCPQPEDGFCVVCPEIKGCFTEGETIDEATANIREVIADFLPDEINGDLDEEMFRLSPCMKGKIFQEIEVELTDSREVVFSLFAKETSIAV